MSTEEEMINLKSMCVTPLLSCPKGESPADCPFAPIRTMDIVESVNWLKRRSAPELRALLAHHRQCATQPDARGSDAI